ncbi:hypothetical protein [Saccharopolyspora spinosa]|uniref:hypothetical protein n=1 Tax=Saccharopolyspora spinosa TaxID=60894 RepID=UPI000237A292|nr:hypothetical protein [Saccharopolyspora spinosa]
MFLRCGIGCAARLGTVSDNVMIFWFTVALSFSMNGVAGSLYAYTSEIYPPRPPGSCRF